MRRPCGPMVRSQARDRQFREKGRAAAPGRKQFFRYAAPASFQSEPLLYRLNQLRPLVANIANSLAYLEPLEIVRRSSLTQR